MQNRCSEKGCKKHELCPTWNQNGSQHRETINQKWGPKIDTEKGRVYATAWVGRRVGRDAPSNVLNILLLYTFFTFIFTFYTFLCWGPNILTIGVWPRGYRMLGVWGRGTLNGGGLEVDPLRWQTVLPPPRRSARPLGEPKKVKHTHSNGWFESCLMWILK